MPRKLPMAAEMATDAWANHVCCGTSCPMPTRSGGNSASSGTTRGAINGVPVGEIPMRGSDICGVSKARFALQHVGHVVASGGESVEGEHLGGTRALGQGSEGLCYPVPARVVGGDGGGLVPVKAAEVFRQQHAAHGDVGLWHLPGETPV